MAANLNDQKISEIRIEGPGFINIFISRRNKK